MRIAAISQREVNCEQMPPSLCSPWIQADQQCPISHRGQLKNYEIPLPLKQEREALHDQLRQAT